MQQNSTRPLKLSNKFELLQSSQKPDYDSFVKKKKEAELQAQIQTYESILQTRMNKKRDETRRRETSSSPALRTAQG